ncbi:MAG: hypothetical protein CM15mP44_7680 [Candidatus Neomarinimicrobiota bacterium]|nr:MAG: hypothetical protein CM15mP44_7680 [Candidatus Neomarinimicrobiota bacterium]
MIIADFAKLNFNTRYIPKNETVNFTIVFKMLGGDSEFVDVKSKKIGL